MNDKELPAREIGLNHKTRGNEQQMQFRTSLEYNKDIHNKVIFSPIKQHNLGLNYYPMV